MNPVLFIGSLLLSCFSDTPYFKAPVFNASENESSNFTNLIVLAKFKGEEEFINDSLASVKERELIDNMYNNSEYSVKEYFKSVSNQNLRMNSIYLFDEGNSITLSKERGYYASYSEENPLGYHSDAERNIRNVELVSDWTNQVNQALLKQNCLSDQSRTKFYPISELDKNKDGYIDSITLIYKPSPNNISVNWSDPLWNYETETYNVKAEKDGTSIQSRSYVQLTHSSTTVYQDSLGYAFTNVGPSIHEMGHVFGLKDLYTNSGKSYIYYMSMMDKHLSPIPQYLSFKEREALGWTKESQSKTITQNGTYTIYPTKDRLQEENICYKVDLKNDTTLYLEYRDFSSSNNRFDSQSKTLSLLSEGIPYKGITSLKSGLVLFQVDSNIKFPSNLYSNRITYQVLGGTYQTKVDAALGQYDYYEDNNDLFDIEVLEKDNDSLTFTFHSEELFQQNQESSIEITSYPSSMKRGDSFQCEAKSGKEENIIWSIENNTSQSTTISSTGLLVIGPDENSESIDIVARNENGKEDRKTVSLIIQHQLEHHDAKDPTCTEKGNRKYYYCKECNQYFEDGNHKSEIQKEDTILPSLGHEEEVVHGENPTCTKTGLADGIICKRCGMILKKQEIIPMLPHEPSSWIIDKEANYEEEGKKHKECIHCQTILEEETIPKLPKKENSENKPSDKNSATKNDSDTNQSANKSDTQHPSSKPETDDKTDTDKSDHPFPVSVLCIGSVLLIVFAVLVALRFKKK